MTTRIPVKATPKGDGTVTLGEFQSGDMLDPAFVPLMPVVANVQSGTSYTLQASDVGKEIQMTNAAANTVVVPASTLASANYVLVRQVGAGATTIAGDGVMNVRRSGASLTTSQQNALMSIRIDSATVAYSGGQVLVAGTPDITLTLTLPSGTVGAAYTGSVSATNIGGASGDITFPSVTLPPGLSLGSITNTSGVYSAPVTGTPTTAAATSASVTATNGTQSKTVALGVTIAASGSAGGIGPSVSVAATTARVAFGPTAAGTVAVQYSPNADLSSPTTTAGLAVDSSTDFTGKTDITGLTAGTTYYYTPVVNGTPQFTSSYPKFKTLPAAGSPAQFSFAFGSCTRHGGSIGADSIFAALPSSIAFLMHLGDTIYADTDGLVSSTLSDFRSKHRNALAAVDSTSVNYKALRASKPIFTMWDDHDLTNDFSAGKGNALYPPASQAFKEYQGRQNPDSITSGELYYSFQVGDVGFFVPDLRSFRSGNTATDNSSKTILGATQKAALKSWLLSNNSALKFKFICASVPANGYGQTAEDSWGGGYDSTQAPNGYNGFRTERNEIWDYIDANQISGVVFLSGDQHWAGSFASSYAGRPRYEFMSSSFNSSFLNPPFGLATDLVNGPVFWTKASTFNAGVVNVDTTVSPPTVSFQLYDPSGSLGSSYLTSLTKTVIDTGLSPSPAVLLALTLPAGTVGVAYTGSIAATNSGGATGTLTLNTFTLPAGLSLGSPSTSGSTTTWPVTGTPTVDTTTTPVTDSITATNGTQTSTASTQVWSIAATAAALYFDPANTNANITLSSGNKIATRGAAADGWYSSRGILGKSSGKLYFELALGTLTGKDIVGFCNGSMLLTAYPGQDANGWGLHTSTGALFHSGGGQPTSIASCAAGGVVMVAIDFNTGNAWIGYNGTFMSAQNPAAGTGALFPTTGILGATLYPAAGIFHAADSTTLRTKTSEFSYTPPTGFSSWSGS